MGSGTWSSHVYSVNSTTRGYDSSDTSTLLSACMDTSNSSTSFNTQARVYNTNVSEKMLAMGVRESRDSEEHPNVTPIVIAVDVTGSMWKILGDILRVHLPQIMKDIIRAGVPDPQIMFAAFGDQYSDSYPFQMGQFESDTEKILNSIQSLYPEEGGGGNDGESPTLIWAACGYHTELDSWYKRNKKGFLFTISDEKCHSKLEERVLTRVFHYEKGVGDKTAKEVLEKAKEQYNVYHIHMDDGSYSWNSVRSNWQELLGENALHCESKQLSGVIVPIITRKNEVSSEEDTTVEASSGEYTY